ncbi:MAG: hypothetical protein HKN73_01600, partial [Gemmatimonadetes bacterium]|nr:hypothetical protein [Gemmatimonadota bacterium]
MTRDELLARYDLIEQVTEGDVETHHALHQSGAVVMVHFLRGSPTRNLAVAQAVQRLGAGEGSSGKVLHVHDVEGQPVVVTRFITDFVSLEHWLATLGLPVAEVDTGGDETLILQPGEGLGRPLDAGAVLQPPPPGPEEPPAPELPPSPVESPPPPQEPPPRGGGGEFTNMFRAAPPAETPPVKPDQALTVETPRPPLD